MPSTTRYLSTPLAFFLACFVVTLFTLISGWTVKHCAKLWDVKAIDPHILPLNAIQKYRASPGQNAPKNLKRRRARGHSKGAYVLANILCKNATDLQFRCVMAIPRPVDDTKVQQSCNGKCGCDGTGYGLRGTR